MKEVAEKLFAAIDTNDNGKLEKEEVLEFSKQMFLSVKPDAEFDLASFEKSFAAMDKNNDGTVSKQELFQSLLDRARSADAVE